METKEMWHHYLATVKDAGLDKLGKKTAILDTVGAIASLRYNYGQFKLGNKDKLPLWFVTHLMELCARVAVQQGWAIEYKVGEIDNIEDADELALDAIKGVLKLNADSLQTVLNYVCFVAQDSKLKHEVVFKRATNSVLYHSVND